MSLSRLIEPLLAAVGRGSHRSDAVRDEDETQEAEPEDSFYPRREAAEVDDIPELIASADRDRVEFGVGHLVGMPEIPRPLAEELVPLLLARAEDLTVGPDVDLLAQTDHDVRAMRRAGYRGLAVIAREHPDLVAPHTARIADSLTSLHVIVREASASALVATLRGAPGMAGAVYPTLVDRREEVRRAGLEVLVEVGDTQPAVLAPIGPHLLEQLEGGAGDTALLVRALERLARRDPATLQAAGPVLLDRLYGAGETDDAAIAEALLGYRPEDGDAATELVLGLLEFVAGADGADVQPVLRHVLAVTDAHPSAAEAAAAWLTDQPAATRRRIRARVDEVVHRSEFDRSVRFVAALDDVSVEE